MRLGLLALLLAALLAPASGAIGSASAAEQRCFPETSQCVEGRLLEYWDQNGGLPVFGYPIRPAAEEYNRDLNALFRTQWFERNRLELHPENQPPYDVLLGRLGAEGLRRLGLEWQGFPKGQQTPGCRWFPETEHSLCDQASGDGFKSYWESHGLEFDGCGGTSYAESLALFGFPITEPRMETNSSGHTVLTQWFERARFEWHPGNQRPYRVLLGLLGNESLPMIHPQNPGLPGRIIFEHYSRTTLAGPGFSPGLYSSNADGTQLRKLVDVEGSFYQISPDGQLIALRKWLDGASGLVLMRSDGSGMRRINADDTAEQFAWSPDSRRLLYTSSGVQRGLHVVNADGSDDRLLVGGTSSHMPGFGRWAPDGASLAYIMQYTETGLYRINADGSGNQRIGDAPRFPGRYAWSSTGRWLWSMLDDGSLMIVDAAGGGSRRIAGAVEAAAWSPNGMTLAYRPHEGPTAIYAINAEGGAPWLVASDVTGGPLWSPGGDQIAYSRLDGAYVASPSGQSRRQLATMAHPPALWSPDGLYLALASQPGCPNSRCLVSFNTTVTIVSADGQRGPWLYLQSDHFGGAQIDLVDWR